MQVFGKEENGFSVYLCEFESFHKIDAAFAKFAFGNIRVRLVQQFSGLNLGESFLFPGSSQSRNKLLVSWSVNIHQVKKLDPR